MIIMKQNISTIAPQDITVLSRDEQLCPDSHYSRPQKCLYYIYIYIYIYGRTGMRGAESAEDSGRDFERE
jgi:hypothetical protein